MLSVHPQVAESKNEEGEEKLLDFFELYFGEFNHKAIFALPFNDSSRKMGRKVR